MADPSVLHALHSEANGLQRRSEAPAHERPLVALEVTGIHASRVDLQATFDGGARTTFTVEALSLRPTAWRLRLGKSAPHEARLASGTEPVKATVDAEALTLHGPDSTLCLNLATGDIVVRQGREAEGRPVCESPGADTNVGGALQSATWAQHDHGYTVRLALRHQELIYGGGEHFGQLTKNGTQVNLLNCDALGVGGQPRYHALPYFFSNHGYGVAVMDAAPSRVDLATRHDVWTWQGTGPGLCLVLQPHAMPRQAVSALRRATQTVGAVPAWSAELWLSRCYYQDGAEVRRVVAEARDRGITKGVINLDARCWMRHETRTDFVWDTSRLPPYETFVPELRQAGFQVCLWEGPYVSSTSALYREGAERGFFARNEAGDVYPLVWVPPGLPGFPQSPPAGIVDFTNPDAWAWWKDQHRPLLRAGVRCFKTDFGEEIPPDAQFRDGSSGWILRNAYADLYNRCVWEVLQEECGDDAMVWARSGWWGAASHPVKWGGDCQASFRGLRASLRGGLGQAVGGALFWSHDTGGFYGPPPSEELYLRWVQLAMWCSHVRLHGTTPREPWHFSESTQEAFRRAYELRQQLKPYFLDAYQRCVENAESFVRPLWMDWPHDPGCAGIDDQFMAGNDVLVAPFLDAAGGRTLYLPAGPWRSVNDGRMWAGECYHRVERLPDAPVFVRPGTLAETCLERGS